MSNVQLPLIAPDVMDTTETYESPVSFLGSTTLISIATIASTAMGLLKNKLFTHLFSTASLDPFFAAFQLPDFIFRIIITGAVAAAFIPVMLEVREKKGDSAAIKFIQNTINLTILILTTLSVVFFFFMPYAIPAIVPGFSAEAQATTIRLSRIMLLSPIILGTSIIIRSTLNAYKKFLTIAITIVFYNLGIILGTLLFAKLGMGIDGLAWAVVLGSLLGLIVQFPAMLRLGIGHSLYTDPKDADVKTMAVLALPRVFGLAIIQISFIVDTALASFFLQGSVTAMKFALQVQDLPINFFAIPASVVAFPSLVEFVARKQLNKAGKATTIALRQTMVFVVPIMIFMLFGATDIMNLLFGSKNMSPDEILMAGNILRLFTISFISQSFVYILIKVYFALHDTKTPVIFNTISILGKVVIALGFFWFVRPLLNISDAIAVLILPFTFSLSQTTNALLLSFKLRGKLPFPKNELIAFTKKMLLASLIMVLGLSFFWFLLVPAFAVLHNSFIILVGGSVIGFGLYIGMAIFCSIEEISIIFQGILRRIRLVSSK